MVPECERFRTMVLRNQELENRLARVEQSLGRLLELAEKQATPFQSASTKAQDALSSIYGPQEVTERMGELVLRLGEPETLEALTRIGVLLPQIEYAANALTAGPELIEEGMEMARSKMAEQGLEEADIQRRLDAGAEALKSLSRVESMAVLEGLGRSLPSLAPFLEAAARTGQDLAEYEGEEAFTDRLAESLLRIIEPETLDSLTRVAAMTPQIEYAVTALTAGPEVLEEALETVRHWAEKNGKNPHEIQRFTENALDALSKLAAPKVSQVLAKMDPAGLVELTGVATEPDNKEALLKLLRLAPQLEPPLSALPVQPHTLELLRTVNEAVEAELSSEPKSVGMFGALAALSDRRVQRALGFGVAVAQRLGQELESQGQIRTGARLQSGGGQAKD